MTQGMTAQEIYGGPVLYRTDPAVSAAPPTGGEPSRMIDPHDPADRGPSDWFEDPVIWVVLIAGLATGVLGVRFKWWKGGAEAGVRVNIGDELATLFAVTLYSITGILLFKVGASKVRIPGLQKVAAAI